ncbi:hypothetical protein CYLTODRAFT_321338, partial [Cylindrobasidium torrendii FP15055 ss-10]
YDGKLGHTYYVNNLAQIIAQELANPQVAPNLSYLPQDSDQLLAEACQGSRWLTEAPDNLLTPMVHVGTQDQHTDFFIHEIARVANGHCCIPFRWFTREERIYGKCWKVVPVNSDGGTAWRVYEDDVFEVAVDQLTMSHTELQAAYCDFGIPDPGFIKGKYSTAYIFRNGALHPWEYTNPVKGNRWRELAEGHRVLSF